jgi:aminoglycoside phosphotransferase (APT) family kinase protein
MQALAAFHALPIREGLDWGFTPGDLYPPDDLPLHRLGFTADERDPAREPLLRAREALWASPFGLAHRDAAAGNILLASGRAWLTDFGAAGYGPQLFDVAAFLLTSGVEPAGRRALAAAYARARGWEAPPTVDLVDLLGILWGIEELLELPRKLIETLGDDATTAQLKLSANRIEKGVRQAAGSSPIATAIRAALWPG